MDMNSKKALPKAVAYCYDWSQELKVQPLGLDMANDELPRLDTERIVQRSIAKNRSRYENNTKTIGRMFNKLKSVTTKGEMAIMEGMSRNHFERMTNHMDYCLKGEAVSSIREAWSSNGCSLCGIPRRMDEEYVPMKQNTGLWINYVEAPTPIANCGREAAYTCKKCTLSKASAKWEDTLSVSPSTDKHQYITNQVKRGFRVPPIEPGSGSAYVEKIQKMNAKDKDVVWQKTVMDIYLPHVGSIVECQDPGSSSISAMTPLSSVTLCSLVTDTDAKDFNDKSDASSLSDQNNIPQVVILTNDA